MWFRVKVTCRRCGRRYTPKAATHVICPKCYRQVQTAERLSGEYAICRGVGTDGKPCHRPPLAGGYYCADHTSRAAGSPGSAASCAERLR
jgi:hypothetical protein